MNSLDRLDHFKKAIIVYDFEDEEDDVFGPPSTITPPKQSKIDFSVNSTLINLQL